MSKSVLHYGYPPAGGAITQKQKYNMEGKKERAFVKQTIVWTKTKDRKDSRAVTPLMHIPK